MGAVSLFALLPILTGCNRASNLTKEVAYVNTPRDLRDRLAAVYDKKGSVKSGDKVYVLEYDKRKRFAHVRGEHGEEGWVETRYIVGPDVFQQFQKLDADSAHTPVQAHGITRTTLNLHIMPGRDADHLYQLPDSTKVDILKRATAEKSGPVATRVVFKSTKSGEEEQKPLEDWSLVRDPQTGHAGWVLARMVDVDLPMDVAQFAEGQRIVGYFVLNHVPDQGKSVPQYLVLMNENKDGMPYDYNQARIFTWNQHRHRYETAYRERNLNGVFPVTVGTSDFGKDGVLPVFTLHTQDDNGAVADRKYRLMGPIVKRVLSPEETQKTNSEKPVRKKDPSSRSGR